MAFSFNGTNQYLSTPDEAGLDISGALTVCAWVKSTGSYGINTTIVGKYDFTINQRAYLLYQTSAGAIGCAISLAGTSAFTLNGATAGNTNWRHAAMVYTPGTRLEIFVNGVSDASTTTSVPASLHLNSEPLEIGGNSPYYAGAICEVAIYNAALTSAEVASLGKGFTPEQIRPQSLVFYAPLVRDLIDVRGGRTITNHNSATVADHPRIYR